MDKEGSSLLGNMCRTGEKSCGKGVGGWEDI